MLDITLRSKRSWRKSLGMCLEFHWSCQCWCSVIACEYSKELFNPNSILSHLLFGTFLSQWQPLVMVTFILKQTLEDWWESFVPSGEFLSCLCSLSHLQTCLSLMHPKTKLICFCLDSDRKTSSELTELICWHPNTDWNSWDNKESSTLRRDWR